MTLDKDNVPIKLIRNNISADQKSINFSLDNSIVGENYTVRISAAINGEALQDSYSISIDPIPPLIPSFYLLILISVFFGISLIYTSFLYKERSKY